ncbi:2954_t:CDS:1, partial [Gigaspora rosea]
MRLFLYVIKLKHLYKINSNANHLAKHRPNSYTNGNDNTKREIEAQQVHQPNAQ